MKIGFVSLGCPKNLVDSEVMLGMAEKEGHEITADASQADVLVVNTCAFIDRAKQESIDTILEMAELKKQAAGTLEREYRALASAAREHRRATRHLVTLTPEAVTQVPDGVSLHSAEVWLLTEERPSE